MAGVKGRSGRRPVTANTVNGKVKLENLLPLATKVIEESLQRSTVTCPHCKKSVAVGGDQVTARWVAEMNLGKPKQQVGLDSGPATIIVRYEGQPETKELIEGASDGEVVELPAPGV